MCKHSQSIHVDKVMYTAVYICESILVHKLAHKLIIIHHWLPPGGRVLSPSPTPQPELPWLVEPVSAPRGAVGLNWVDGTSLVGTSTLDPG